MKRIFLFLATNLAVLALLTVVIFVIERVFGVQLTGGGLGGLLVFAAVCGFGGSLISQSDALRWLIATVKRLAEQSRISMPEVPGHEISHVSNGDMVTLALLQGVLNTIWLA